VFRIFYYNENIDISLIAVEVEEEIVHMQNSKKITRFKKISVWLFVIIVGFICYVLSQIFFQMGSWGGYQGVNLTIVGLIQALLILPLIYFGLKQMGIKKEKIGISSKNLGRDALVGICVAISWAILQFVWLIPSTGGADRKDIAQILTMIDGQWMNVLWYIPLGIIGGGITEEIYNRGFFIGAINETFDHSKLALWIAAIISILFFVAGHLPTNFVEWVDLLIPTIAYTLMFLSTKRLTASIVAHGLWNTLAVVLIYIIYA
jgi:hypothetical protein